MNSLLTVNPSRTRFLRAAVLLLVAAALATVAMPSQEADARGGGSWKHHRRGFSIETLSSAPRQVSGGDVLVRVHVPGRRPLKRVRGLRTAGLRLPLGGLPARFREAE